MAGLVMKSACELCHLYVDHYERFLEYRNVALLAIDDLGMEPERIVKYGQVCDPISELIAYRYECRLFTIVTTNLPSGDIRPRYGDRTADRVNHMMHVVVMPDFNFRLYSETYSRD